MTQPPPLPQSQSPHPALPHPPTPANRHSNATPPARNPSIPPSIPNPLQPPTSAALPVPIHLHSNKASQCKAPQNTELRSRDLWNNAPRSSTARHDSRGTSTLRFSPTAWAKLQYFGHAGDTEIGGFGISDPDDLLLVMDFQTVRQRTTAVTVAFDDQAVADFYEDQVDLGRSPAEFSRIWLHTHPGTSPAPSGTDEETFGRVFSNCDWAVMAILAKGGQT